MGRSSSFARAVLGRPSRPSECFSALMKAEGYNGRTFSIGSCIAAVQSCLEQKDLIKGKAFHCYMLRNGFVELKMGCDSGVAISNALIDIYGKCGSREDAYRTFEDLEEKDIYSWNSILCVHYLSSEYESTLRLFNRMLRAGLLPDLVTVTIVLPACSNLAALVCGIEIHSYMVASGMDDTTSYSGFESTLVRYAIMDMYTKCGNLTDALLVFKSMVNKDVASWNVMIMGYGMQGSGSKAVAFFKMMCQAKIKPDEVSFMAVLSACSHAGYFDQGREFLSQMELEYGVTPTIKHYGCVGDMLGRANYIEEAYEVALTMPVEANPVIWRVLLSPCHLYGNTRIAQLASRQVA